MESVFCAKYFIFETFYFADADCLVHESSSASNGRHFVKKAYNRVPLQLWALQWIRQQFVQLGVYHGCRNNWGWKASNEIGHLSRWWSNLHVSYITTSRKCSSKTMSHDAPFIFCCNIGSVFQLSLVPLTLSSPENTADCLPTFLLPEIQHPKTLLISQDGQSITLLTSTTWKLTHRSKLSKTTPVTGNWECVGKLRNDSILRACVYIINCDICKRFLTLIWK